MKLNLLSKRFASQAIIILLLFLTGCISLKQNSIRGTYPSPPFVYTSTQSFENVWSNIIDLFAQEGLPIRIIDKSSGLIISDISDLSWTFENDSLKANKPDKHVVIGKYYFQNKIVKPQHLVGQWNIHLKKSDNGGTSINVNLVNLVVTSTVSKYNTVIKYDCRSTGQFEKKIAEIIK